MKIDTEQLIRGGGKHRRTLFAALALCGALAALAVAFRGRFTNDVSRLFPDTRETRATFDILHKSHLSDTVQLEFVCRDDVTKYEKYLDETVGKLKRSPLVKRAVFRYRANDPAAEAAHFSKLAPRFFAPEILDACDPEAAAKSALGQLASPAPGVVRRLRSQPFNWDLKLLAGLGKLDAATGMKLARNVPYFATTDLRRAMIVVDSDVKVGDADAVRKLFSELRRCAEPLPDGLEMRIVSGCAHTLGNEEVLKRDATTAGAVSLVLFLLIFAWFYRGDRRALWIPLLPVYASLVSLAAMTFIFREICLYVIGLGGCITGLAVDQGIHVYAAFRGGDAEKRTAALAEPMLLSAATSVAVFVFLAFTGIAAYIQLAVFAGMSLISSAILALLVLPHLLDREHGLRRVFSATPAGSRRTWAPVAVLVLVAAAFFVLPQIVKRADFALESLDGTPEEVRRAEREFRAAWRKPAADTAVLAAAGENGEAALEHLQAVAAELRKRGIDVALPPRPSVAEQRANREKWRRPEVAAKIDEVEKRSREACRRHKLPPKFFDPFFGQLRADIASNDLTLPPMLEYIDRKMIKSGPGGAAAVALLSDTPENASVVREVLREHGAGKAALLSKNGFKVLIREELGGRFGWLLPVSVLAALAMLFAVFRKAGDVVLAMVPVAVAFSGVALVMYLTRFRATPAAAFALVLLTGLAVDYGIYAVSQLRRPGELDTADPILLSAATTVAGAGALLVSRHPALFGTGAVLAPGIALACLSGIYLVPMLKHAKLPKKALPLLLSGFPILCVSGCASATPWAEYPGAEAALRQMRPYPDGKLKIQALVTFELSPKRSFRFVLAAKIDPESGDMTLAGVDPGSGALLFKYGGASTERPWLQEALSHSFGGTPDGIEGFRWLLARDLRRIFLLKNDIPLAATEKREYIAVDSADGVSWELRRDGPAMRKCGTFPFRKWRTIYFDGGKRMIYDRYDGGMGYTLKIKINEIRQVKK